MSGDYSRISFDPREHDLGVLLQQGRPLSDADWNALVLQLRQRLHAGSLDTFGPAVVPMQTPDAFGLSFSGGQVQIGRGRIYVDGILAENHGTGPAVWDPKLEQSLGTLATLYRAPAATPERQQPYYPNPPAIPANGRHLVYLDVWQREVTHVLRPGLVDAAVGVDGTTRLQTVWQVRLIHNVGTNVSCSTDLATLPGLAPSAGRLSIATAEVPGEPDPCLVPPDGGYKGLENQLYRVEIHQGGAAGAATFKWSRENASVESRVTHLPALDRLVVDSIGRDVVLGFNNGDWVEVTDDWREFNGQPGELRRLRAVDGVDDATRTLLLDQPLTAGLFPTGPGDRTHPDRNTRVKRWDQRGVVRNEAGNALQDLDVAASTGAITVPAGAVSVLLENGIVARFSLSPAGGQFRSGDYWVFAARTATAEVETLDAAPPRGIHHHYAKLGFLTLPGTFDDCRQFWPPPTTSTEAGDHCACTVCVTPAQHEAQQPSIQDAIDKVIEAGGGTVCLEVGTYRLRTPLRIDGAQSLRITGKGNATSLVSDEAVFEPITGCKQLALERLEAVREQRGGPVLSVGNSSQVRIDQLRLVAPDDAWGIGLDGALFDVAITASHFQTGRGIFSNGKAELGTGLADVRIDDNHFECRQSAIELPDVAVHQMSTRIAGNTISNCEQFGILLTGAAAPGFGVDVSGNTLVVLGEGIVGGLDRLSLHDNQISSAKPHDNQSGVMLVPGLGTEVGLADCVLRGNRILGFGIGITVKVPLVTASFRQNLIEGPGAGLMARDVSIGQVAITDNQFRVGTEAAIQWEGSPLVEHASIVLAGNQVTAASGKESAVTISLPKGTCQFTHNHCVQPSGSKDGNVHLAGSTLVVASNRVTGGRELSMKLEPDQSGDRKADCTVLGNITGGVIRVRGTPLDVPWLPLNLQNIA